MTIESNTGIPAINPEVKPGLNWVVYQVPHEEIIHPNEIPAAVKSSEIEFKGKIIPIILPDIANPLFKEDEFIKDNHATKNLRQLFKYNNDQIGVAGSYAEDLQNRREVIEIIKQLNPDISPPILKSMKRSLLARAYHTEKRIRQIENNNPIRIIKGLVSNIVFKNESEIMLKDRKSADTVAVFDKKIERIFKKFLRKEMDADKNKGGGVLTLKRDFEYYLVKIIENYYQTSKMELTRFPISFITLINNSLNQEQEFQHETKLNNARSVAEYQRINIEPRQNLEEFTKEYIDNQVKISSFFR